MVLFSYSSKPCLGLCFQYTSGRRNISIRDAARISEMEESEALMERKERHLAAKDTCCQKCLVVLRPFQIVFGIVFIALALLIFISLLLTK